MPILWGTSVRREQPPPPPGSPILAAGLVGTFIIILALLTSS